MADRDEPTPRDEIADLAERAMIRAFRSAPIALVRGEGVHVWDASGRKYLDLVGGIAVNALGYGHPRVIEAAEAQLRAIVHTSNLYLNEPQVRLAAALGGRFGGGRAFLCNSGTEANEAALKLARRHAAKVRGEPARSEIVAFERSFHGRTFGALSVTGQPQYHDGFAPLLPGVRFARFNDLASVEAAVGERTCAVIVEPIQAEGGLIPARPGFLAELARLCRERGALLIADEIQTGCGRTGTFFAFEQEGFRPDAVTLAKALGGGLPIGALVATEDAASGFEPGSHGTTFGGNALACRVALAVLDEIDRLLPHVRETGAWFGAELARLRESSDLVEGARGRGLIWGLGLTREVAAAVAERCAARGLLVNRLDARTLRFLPPLVCRREDLEAGLAILRDVLGEIGRAGPPSG